MESPASSRGRGRSSTRKRHAVPATSSSHKLSEALELTSSGTPAAGTAASSSVSFETPSPSTARGSRIRTRNLDGATAGSPEDPDKTAGRSLRKRTRVDYNFDHIDDYENEANKTTPTASRSLKKRKTDSVLNDNEVDEESEARVKRRASEQPQNPPRRRTNTRKSTVEPQPYVPEQHMEDIEVQDTIEVGGHYSEESEESALRRTSSGSSYNDSKPTRRPNRPTSAIPIAVSQDSQAGSSPPYHGTSRSLCKAIGPKEVTKPAVSDLPDIGGKLDHLTPYIDGAHVYYPTHQPDLDPEPEAEIAEDGVVEDQLDDTPAASPGGIETTANSPVAEPEPAYLHSALKKALPFKQTRKASEFTELFEDAKSLPPEELWRRLEVVNRVLVAWQDEYNELRKITDDEDNAQRYQQEEVSFQHRRKMARSKDPDADPLRKDFVVKGIRAEKPDPLIAYTKQQDKIMANSYLFEYDDRESKVGLQDPIGQRGGVGKGRLRDRPKQTAKAAEADDANVVHGKRSRKPPVLFDGIEATSRGSTPVPTQRKRRRAGQDAEENGDGNLAVPAPLYEAAVPEKPETPKKKGKGGRPRKHPLPTVIPEDRPTPIEEPEPEPEPELQAEPEQRTEEAKPTRKRRRRAKATQEEVVEAAPNGANMHAVLKSSPRRGNSRMPEVPSSSFYTNSSMPSTNPADESRPQTSSSTATQSTVASNSYQLREKRQKKFSLNDSDDEYGEPKPKRVRRAPKKTQIEDFAPAPEPAPVQEPDPEVPIAPKPQTKIRLKNYNPHPAVPAPTSAPVSNPPSMPPSSDSTPFSSSNGNGAVNGNGNGNGDALSVEGEAGLEPKPDYNSMTKSEKMSYSMKARWASGSMSPAVAKRRATLAAKKQAVPSTEIPGQGPIGGGMGQQ